MLTRIATEYIKMQKKAEKRQVYIISQGKVMRSHRRNISLITFPAYIGQSVLVLDYESSAVDQGVGWAKDWLDAVYNMTGVKPVIYMSNSVVHRYDWSEVAKNYSLWNAGYYAGYNTIYGFIDNPPLHYDLGEFSGKTPLFQYTSSGRLNGWTGNLDLDVFYGDSADWDKLAGCVASDNYKPSEPNHKAEDRVVYYTVRSGDTLSRIAQRYNTTYKYLAELNGIANRT